MSFFGIKGAFLRFSRKREDESAPSFFQDLENTCSLQPALKSNTPGLKSISHRLNVVCPTFHRVTG